MGGLGYLLSGNEFTLSSFVESVLYPFAPTFGVQLLVIILRIRQGLSPGHETNSGSGPLPPRDDPVALWILPLQVWCLQASLRTISFWNMVSSSNGPEPKEGIMVLFHSLLALGVLLLVQTTAVLAKNWTALPLGLTPKQHAAFISALLAVVLDAFLLPVIARWAEPVPQGIPVQLQETFNFEAISANWTPDDGDGVRDYLDVCSGTKVHESVPTRRLGVNRFALVDDDDVFDTILPSGGAGDRRRSFTIRDTAGCSCEQIIEALRLLERLEDDGSAHKFFGCSFSAMEAWVALVNP